VSWEIVALREIQLHQLEPVHALHAHEVRVCPLQARRLSASVEVYAEAVLGCDAEGLLHEAHHLRVVALHEVDLEALDAAT